MAQNNNIAQPVKRFTRIDFTALRFRLAKIQSSVFALYSEDDLDERGLQSHEQLLSWLDDLRDQLIDRARDTNPLVARTLEDARLRNLYSKSVIDFICEQGEKDLTQPRPTDPVTIWFKPIVSRMLLQDDIKTLGDLKQCIELRGQGWYKPIPRIGSGKARAIESWLRSHASLGAFKPSQEAVVLTDQVELSPYAVNPLVPMERVSHVVAELDGSQGRNRNSAYCLISARNDLEAIQAYLYRFRAKEKTLRAYQKELERFLLWCVCVRQTPLSGVLTEECEAYKDFLASLTSTSPWVGPKVLRKSPRWKPFAGALSAESQRYAVQVIRTFFEWLMKVRYLNGNPWVTVADPAVDEKELEMAIDKALPDDLWKALADEEGLLDRACAVHEAERLAGGGVLQAKASVVRGAQYRLARAAILLLGLTGIRREEAARATRDKLKPVKEGPGKAHGLWELSVLGKRNKWRTVFMPPRVVDALRAHWEDRGHDFDFGMYEYALLSPVVVPNTHRARDKHLAAAGELGGSGFSPDGIYKLVKTTLERLAEDEAVPLTLEERELLKQTAPHAFRHTFATRAAAHEMPTDVLQRALGHASQTTTTIYVRAERKRSIEEAAKFFGS